MEDTSTKPAKAFASMVSSRSANRASDNRKCCASK